jgi:ATP-binding cassette subfamily B protein/subfamily B ATP-binding cassette protein MsbA
LLKPWPLALIIDSVIGEKPFPHWLGEWDGQAAKAWLVMLFSAAIFALHLGQGLLSATQNYLAIQVGLGGLRRVRNEVFACLQRFSFRFHQGTKTGDLIYRASWDAYSFQTLFQQGMITFGTALFSLVLMVIVMCRMNMAMTLVAVATVPLLLLAMKIFGRQMRERGVVAQQADSQVTSLVQQNIVALPLIQSYNREDFEESRFTQQTAVAQEKRLSQHGSELLYWLAISVVFGLGTAAIVWLGSHQVLQNKLTVGQLLIFLAYLAQLYEPLNQLSHVGATVATAGTGAQRVFEILDTPEEVKDAPHTRAIQSSKLKVQSPQSLYESDIQPHAERATQNANEPLSVHGEISFDHVSFGYQKEQLVLRDVNFTLRPGESAAIIGPSGVGKSTLLSLLPRFFDPTLGVVRLDGVDLRELRLRDLRAQIALVLQEPILLPTTLAENISYGKPDATTAEIEAASRAANAHSFIEKLPQKYQTIVGEGAVQLSVGERQRINLARAFLKDAPILLLDEPTSALDAESETQVVASMFELMRGRTTLIVAHRSTTIRRVDKVLVLEEGRLTESGSPAELLQRKGYFARVVSGREN